MRLLLGVTVCAAMLVLCRAAPAPPGESFVYFGTYTGFQYVKKGVPVGQSRSKGIYVSRFQAATGAAGDPVLAAETRNPSFLAVHPNHHFLYAVSEDPLSVGPANDQGSYVSAYRIEAATGRLALLNTIPSGGAATAYISVDKSGQYLLAASYGSGSIAVFQIRTDGSLGGQTSVIRYSGQGVSHPQSFDVSPDNRFAVVSDLAQDKLFVYRFDADAGSLAPSDPPSVSVSATGGSPRHFIFSSDGKFGYVIGEMSGLVTAFSWNADRGILTEIQAADTVPRDFNEDKNAAVLNPFRSAELALSPDGRFLYNSNRGPDTIAVSSVDAGKGTLSAVEQVSSRGLMPRSFALDPSGAYLLTANELTDSVVVFQVERNTGRLTPTRTVLHVYTPVCVVFCARPAMTKFL